MKALSVRQPWAWAILHAGKDIENRDWKSAPSLRNFRGPFLLHAGGAMSSYEYENFIAFVHAISEKHPFPSGLYVPEVKELPRGGIVGMADLVDIVTDHTSPWFMGSYGLVLKNARPLPFIPLKGALGWFDVPAEVLEQVRQADIAGEA